MAIRMQLVAPVKTTAQELRRGCIPLIIRKRLLAGNVQKLKVEPVRKITVTQWRLENYE